ncbi:hypothetical protein HNR59_002869 [Aquamicrobium lusatiense]|uniref:Bacteriophage tail tape measure N-terminal domain-containing protein n=1 Tax=Aquamicrobium lusatiense TaxID=89772 RepID=A0A7W9S448_9HYPH|nr:phage tail length tape measure family protein [Aquamicrobium lusatiense]MBB6013480.1 hypothetical protein [Aquamicrobium lusatiense]
MADKTDDLVIGVSTDLSSVQRAIKKLDGDIARAGSQIEQRFAAVGKSIDKAIPTGMQDRINKMVGVQVAATKEWTGALANQGKEMEKLRAKFSPMFSTITSYKTAVNEIRAAHRLGAISADEMATAIQRERQAALSSIAAIKQRNAALSDTPLRGGNNRFNTANIAAQFQDIGVTTAMGMNPLTIALQQGTQLSAVFESMKGTGQSAGQAIGEAFKSIISPMSLVTIGVIAAGTAIVQYAMSGGKEVEKFDEMLKRHKATIDSLGPAYKGALVNAREYMADPAVANALRSHNEKELAQRIAKETAAAAKAIDAAVQSAIQTSLGTTTAQTLQEAEAQSMFRPFMEAIERLKSGASDARQFRDEIVLIGASGEGLTEAVTKLRGMIDPVVEMMQALDDAERKFDAVQVAVNALAAEINQISSAKAREELNGLLEKAREGEISVKDLLAELSRISGYAPDVSTIISAFRAVAEAAAAARQASAGIVGKESQGGRVRYNTTGYMQLPDSVGITPTSRPLIEFEAPPKPRGGGGARAPKKTSGDRFFEDIEAIKQRTIALAEERAQLGLSYEAQQKRKVAFDLEQKALKDAREAARQKGDQDWQNAQLTPKQIQQIDEASAAYARQAEELRRAQNEMAVQRDIVQGIMSDVRSALEDGKITTEEWGNIFLGVIDKIVDKLQNDLLDALFEAGSASKGIGGGGGSILSFIPKLFGFASGTANTGGRRGEPRGVVHGQEAVIPLPSGGKVPVQIQAPVAPSYVNRSGPASTETIRVVLQDDSGRMADIADQQIRTRSGALVQLSVQQSVKSVRGQMSGMIAETQARKL